MHCPVVFEAFFNLGLKCLHRSNFKIDQHLGITITDSGEMAIRSLQTSASIYNCNFLTKYAQLRDCCGNLPSSPISRSHPDSTHNLASSPECVALLASMVASMQDHKQMKMMPARHGQKAQKNKIKHTMIESRDKSLELLQYDL